jgi:hypothetical protein
MFGHVTNIIQKKHTQFPSKMTNLIFEVMKIVNSFLLFNLVQKQTTRLKFYNIFMFVYLGEKNLIDGIKD